MYDGDDTTFVYGRRRSFIRRIGSFLPSWFFAPVGRIYLNENLFTGHTRTIEENNYYNPNNGGNNGRASSNSSSTMSSCSCLDKVDSMPTKDMTAEMVDKELKEIRKDVAGLIRAFGQFTETVVQHSRNLNQCTSQQMPGDISTKSNAWSTPIPPPPPLPPFPLSGDLYSDRKILRESQSVDSDTKKDRLKIKSPFISMTDILMEMRTFKLKPVSRTPDVSSKKSLNEDVINNDLRSVLRRRYSAMKMDTPDSKNESEDSGTWESPQAIFTENKILGQKRLLF